MSSKNKANGQSTKQITWDFWVKGAHDILFVGSATAYIAGYFVWAFYAFQNDLGALTALDAQYFVAGTLPVVITGLSYLAYILFLNLIHKLKASLYKNSADAKNSEFRKSWLRFILFSIAFTALCLFPFNTEGKRFSWVGSILVFIAIFAVCLIDTKETKLYKFFKAFEFGIFIFPFAFSAITFYYSNIFQNLPQEFGGAKPRCSYLDVYQSSMSQETLHTIAPQKSGLEDQAVIQTREIEILFSGREEVIVRIDGKVLSIAKNVIQVIKACP